MSVEKIIQIERSHRRVLLIAIVAIAAFALYRWILAPHTNQLLAAQRYNSALDGAIHKAGFLGTIQELKKAKIEELTKESDRQRNQLFSSPEVRQFLASLPSVVSRSGCVVQSVSAAPEAPRNPQSDGSGIVAKRAIVTFTGGYNNVIKFIGAIQDSEQKVWIESVRMETGGAGKLKCQVLLTVYCIERAENS